MPHRVSREVYDGPNRSTERKPSSQSVLFNGVFINLSTIAMYSGLTVQFISMIFSGKRQPSLPSARKIAKALNMDLSAFVDRLDHHIFHLEPAINKIRKSA